MYALNLAAASEWGNTKLRACGQVNSYLRNANGDYQAETFFQRGRHWKLVFSWRFRLTHVLVSILGLGLLFMGSEPLYGSAIDDSNRSHEPPL
jgi:hypothetical protein